MYRRRLRRPLLFGGFHRRLGLAKLIAAGTNEYVQDRLLSSNEGRPGPSHLDVAGTADRRSYLLD
jgi:hypothetical protein